MKKIRFFVVALVSVGVLLALVARPLRLVPSETDGQPLPVSMGQKIPLDATRWYQVVNADNGLARLSDGDLTERVSTGAHKLLANYDAYYPLHPGETMVIKAVRFYDGMGTFNEPLTLSIITKDWERVPIARFTGADYNAWVGPDPTRQAIFTVAKPVQNARYLVLNTSGAYPNELELYGSYQPGQEPKLFPRRAVAFRQLIGVNGFEWNVEDDTPSRLIDEGRVRALRGFAGFRHYLDWEKMEPKPGQYTFNPTNNGSWNYDRMYERLNAEGLEVLACIKALPPWLEATYPPDKRSPENVPARWGSDLLDPRSYVEQARMGFQYAARYGRNKAVNPALVRVSTEKTWAGQNAVKIGLGLVRYMECDNERDKTWKGRQAYQSAREYAANLSAFYDGHKGKLGPGVGVKTADPSMQVVIGGIAASSTDYVRAMIDWCREFRGYHADGRINLCWDVMNQHLYANNAQSSQGGGSERGAAPEVSGVGEQAAAFVKVARQYANGMPVWITESGYDLHPESPFHVPLIGKKSAPETQADWILRTALLYSRVGIDRLFFYQLYDYDLNNPTQFASMGLLNGNKTRKPAADYLVQARRLLGDYEYAETISQDPLVDRYVRKEGQREQQAYVLLIPDEQGREGSYRLTVTPGDTVRLFKPTIGRERMTETIRISDSGSLTIKVSETPLFVLVSPVGNRNIAQTAHQTTADRRK